MAELLAAVLDEDENGNFSLGFHLNDQAQLTPRTDKLLSALVQARAAMQPPVDPAPPQPGVLHEAIFGSQWRVDPDLAGNVAIRFLHPALGWVSWHVERQAAYNFAAVLTQVLDQAGAPGPAQ